MEADVNENEAGSKGRKMIERHHGTKEDGGEQEGFEVIVESGGREK